MAGEMNGEMNGKIQETDRVFLKMAEFDAGDARRIQHFTKVYAYAGLIGRGEGLDDETQHTLELAAIVHDIGIRPAEEAYGYQTGKLQEKLGPAHARRLLEAAGVKEAIIRRVEFLVGHHHTYEGVDAPDWQILLEADFLVNSFEDGMEPEAVKRTMDKMFRTGTGIRLCKNMYDLDKGMEEKRGNAL